MVSIVLILFTGSLPPRDAIYIMSNARGNVELISYAYFYITPYGGINFLYTNNLWSYSYSNATIATIVHCLLPS